MAGDALVPGLDNCGWERAGGVYTAVPQDVKKEILVKLSFPMRNSPSFRLAYFGLVLKTYATQLGLDSEPGLERLVHDHWLQRGNQIDSQF